MNSKLLLSLLLMGIVLVGGCIYEETRTKYVTRYVCSDGRIVSYSQYCPTTSISESADVGMYDYEEDLIEAVTIVVRKHMMSV